MLDGCSIIGWDVRWGFGTKISSGGTLFKWGYGKDKIFSLKCRAVWTQRQNRLHNVSERGQGICVKDQSRIKEIRAGMVNQGGKNPGTKEKPL